MTNKQFVAAKPKNSPYVVNLEGDNDDGVDVVINGNVIVSITREGKLFLPAYIDPEKTGIQVDDVAGRALIEGFTLQKPEGDG
jgi:hypothetical protein